MPSFSYDVHAILALMGSRGVGTGAEAMPLRESKRGTDPCHTSIMGGPHSPGFSGGLWASDGESDSHRAFLFRHDVRMMVRRQLSEEKISTISIAWYLTTKSGGI